MSPPAVTWDIGGPVCSAGSRVLGGSQVGPDMSPLLEGDQHGQRGRREGVVLGGGFADRNHPRFVLMQKSQRLE